MIRHFIALLVFLTGLLFAASAFAAKCYTTGNANMRTGPSVYYPRIAVIPDDSPVTNYYCTQDQNWCDVRWHAYRGWVFRGYLRFTFCQPRMSAPPPGIYFNFDFRDRRWRDGHNRWHKAKPYPRREKKIIRRDWNSDHDRWHQKNSVSRKRIIRRRNCPPNRDCD